MRRKLKKGYVHIYTGSGKGKTTASIGIAVRAASAGLNVCMFQFLKKRGSAAENKLRFPNFKIVCLDESHPMFSGPKTKSRKACVATRLKIAEDIKRVKRALEEGRHDVLILDELINCVSERFLDERIVLDLIRSKPRSVELVLTGRGATKRMMMEADYVTELKKVSHPFERGVAARKGIEY